MGPPGFRFSEGRRRNHRQHATSPQHAIMSASVRSRAMRLATRRLHTLPDIPSVTSAPTPLHRPFSENTVLVAVGYGGMHCWQEGHGAPSRSWLARDEGWLAEHMLIRDREPRWAQRVTSAARSLGLRQDNLAMLGRLRDAGMEGMDCRRDIAWLRRAEDGRLWAVNPKLDSSGSCRGRAAVPTPTRST